MDTCRGHYNNVSCVLFHPRQDLILSKSHTPLGGPDSSAGAVDTVWFGSGEVVGFMHTLGGL